MLQRSKAHSAPEALIFLHSPWTDERVPAQGAVPINPLFISPASLYRIETDVTFISPAHRACAWKWAQTCWIVILTSDDLHFSDD